MQTDKDAERESIDSEIAQLQDSILKLRTRRNSIAPISKLPSDLFTSILMITLLDDAEPDSCSIVSFTHVCRSWRNLAIDDALLWTKFYIRNDAQPQPSIIARSKTAPIRLAVSIGFGHMPSAAFLEFASSNVYRVREIIVDVYSPQGFVVVMDALNKAAPRLQNAHLHNITELAVPSSFRLLDQHCASLRILNIYCWSVEWEKLDVSYLTELHLSTELVDDGQTNRLLSLSTTALRRMTSLQVFRSFQAVLPCPPDYQGEKLIVPESDQINMPFLRDLQLSNSSFRECAFFMNHIKFPPVLPKITLWITPKELDDSPFFLHAGDSLEIAWSRDGLDFIAPSVIMGVFMEGGDVLPCFQMALQALDMKIGLKSLTLSMNNRSSYNHLTWLELLPLFPDLTRLELDLDKCGQSLLFALLSAEQSLMPKLKELVIRIGEWVSISPVVYRLVQLRHMMGFKISQLMVHTEEGELTTEEVKCIKRHVDLLEINTSVL